MRNFLYTNLCNRTDALVYDNSYEMRRFFVKTNMSQDNLIRLVSQGNDDGVGAGHVIWSKKNKKKLKERLSLKKFNPVARTHTLYVEKK